MISKRNLINRMCKNLLLYIMVLGILSGCDSGSNSNITAANNIETSKLNTSNYTKQHKPLRDDFFLLQPGAGYDSSSNTAVSDQSCLQAAMESANIYIANPSGGVTLSSNVQFGDLEKILGLSIDGSMSGGMFSGSLAASYLEASEDNSYAMNLIYLYQYTGIATFAQGSIGQGESALTQYAGSLAFGGQPTLFRQTCGDSYVSQMNAGALLGITINLAFDSNADKEAFKAKLNVDAGIVNIAAAIQQAATSANVNVQMSLNALQLGGDPQDLNNLFGSVSPDGNYPYLDCGSVNGQNQNACTTMIADVISYAQSMESQVSNADGSINLQKMYYTNPVISSYHTLGITANAPDPSESTLAAVRTVTSLYNNANFDYTFVNHYLATLGSYLGTGTTMALQDASYRLNQQINGVFLGTGYNLFNCYRGYISNNCVTTAQNIQTALESAPYALPSYESQEIDYLERNIYKAKLYGYNGESTPPQVGNYVMQACMLYPISSPITAAYAVSCSDDTFFPITSSQLTITQVTGSGVQLNGLQYNAINSINGAAAQIAYPNSLTLPTYGYPNEFEVGNLLITGDDSNITTAGILKLVQVPRSQN